MRRLADEQPKSGHRWLGKNKARLILLNKADLAEEKWNDAWMEYFKKKGYSVVKVNSRKGGGIKSIQGVIQEASREKIERDRKRGIFEPFLFVRWWWEFRT